jgi:hypothetical protein
LVDDHLPEKQEVGCAESSYARAFGEFVAAIVVETVAVASSRYNKAQHPDFLSR